MQNGDTYGDARKTGRKILELDSLVKIYHKRRVVNRISFEIMSGEIVGLLGPNGAGKTTTFYMVVGLVKPDAGKIILNNTDITNEPMYRRARLGIGYLPQEASIFRKLTVRENLDIILEMQDLTKQEMEEKRERLLSDLSISHLAPQKAYTLSGGERRRLEIARTLVTDPDFILLDEPFAGVDPIAVADIQSIISALKERGIGVLITDHNVRETLTITDRSCIIHEGKILISGKANQLIRSKKAREIYLGEEFSL
ncbi:MAG TPA: LPS export ABC transporter ATP-binding protein [Spirochaetota bacterium]|nr:LPS export ABC transporter ATP-binding protein [Spirochaetota bacterium]HNT10879.1 LPS export ABC transporter ATP-binding protein [Spirochaetota bacterium]HNV45943.1 LPS export ABC transporter ATP-binding protein [Spirochaetota bacterium]HOS41056.1 LPS export ABC transporter ATP-binding protein [Spirochaetota bacterium]HPI23327.1 LPS export ABC transporter ATP-binding protein [Spirochaetota bacterium]